MNAAYARLKSRHARIATLGEASAMLGWDASAMMPPGGGAARGEQLATLAGLMHEMATAPEVADDLAAAEAEGEWDEANLALMRHEHIRATALPTPLVEASSRGQQHLREDLARGAAAFGFQHGPSGAGGGAAPAAGDGPGLVRRTGPRPL